MVEIRWHEWINAGSGHKLRMAVWARGQVQDGCMENLPIWMLVAQVKLCDSGGGGRAERLSPGGGAMESGRESGDDAM